MELVKFKTDLARSFGRVNLQLQKHSPEILLGVGLVGMVVAAVMAAKATLKVDEVIEEHNEALERADIPEEKTATMVYVNTGLELAKIYGPSVGLGALSIAAILASHGVMANRQVSLAAAYNLMVNGFNAYRQRVVEELGLDKDQDFLLGIREEMVKDVETDADGNTKKVKKSKVTMNGDPLFYARMFDTSNPNWKVDANLNMAWLESQERWLNDKLIIRGYLFLNEVWEDLGMSPRPEGQLVGWILRSPEQMKKEHRDGYISLGLNNKMNMSGQAYSDGGILINPNVDGVVHNLI